MLPTLAYSAENQPIADMHIHYNWDQAEVVSAEDIIHSLQQANVRLALVSSTPSHLALQLRAAGGNWIIPFFSPYINAQARQTWYVETEVVNLARQGLEKGLYQGIGEVHFMAGMKPWPDDPGFLPLLQLAGEFKVPMLIHVDASHSDYYLAICRKYPGIQFILAHAGGVFKTQQLETILATCPNTMVDLSARDPWRYGGLTDSAGKLKKDWRSLLLSHSHRFMIGTDPVWRVTRTQSWDQADDGWDHFRELMQFHLTWLKDLPAETAEQIRYRNALDLFPGISQR